MSKSDPLSMLPSESICFSTEKRDVRLDGELPEVERNYLMLSGTPEGFLWLARRFTQMAKSAQTNESGTSAIIDPIDFKNAPLKLADWDALDIVCCQQRES